jgi:hypothetical protein
MSLSAKLAIMKANLEDCEKHIKSLESGRKSSSAKSRSMLMKIKQDSHTLRKEIIMQCKSLPVKSRAKKVAKVAEEEPNEPEEVAEVEKKVPKKKRTPKKAAA